MDQIAATLQPPYYAVIFTSIRTEGNNGYSENAERILQIAKRQPGYLGFESARNSLGISVSYWKDMKSIELWKSHLDHQFVKAKAHSWYKSYMVRISRVEQQYGSDFIK